MGERSEVIIRKAAPEDATALGRLGAGLVALHHDFDPDRFIAPGPGTARGYGGFLASQLDQPEVIVLAAEGPSGVVGYAYAGIEGADWMALRGPAGAIYDLVVDPAHRRQGLGRRLLTATMQALAERGAPRIVLSTAERNAAAQRLFASAGFRATMIEMTRDVGG
jgi:ribosomal protein S18 acetylase RimI-like enzyme